MPESLSEHLNQDMQCEGLMQCLYGLRELDRQVYEVMVKRSEPMTVDEIANAVSRERSTAYRSVRRLLQAGFIQQEQVNYDDGGYYHVYHPADPEQIAEEMRRILNEWYAKIGQLIQEFQDKYADQQPQPTTTEP